LKNRKTDLKEQNKRLPTIQETNACWQITNLSFTSDALWVRPIFKDYSCVVILCHIGAVVFSSRNSIETMDQEN
jgi:hypothetical protein